MNNQYNRIQSETKRRYGFGSKQAVRNAQIFSRYQGNIQKQPSIAKAMQQARSLMQQGRRNDAMAIEGRARQAKFSRAQYMGLANG